MGSEDARCAIFLWNGTADDAVTTIDLPRPKPPRKKLLKLGETVNNFNDVDCNYMVRYLTYSLVYNMLICRILFIDI